ncbi:MAG TPA: hypothetical protein VNB49_15800 [Candidatus Dormibacteraeota bacterium]|nr:hypothetical protein [Candidatus Dormibacteraeota bacterium]
MNRRLVASLVLGCAVVLYAGIAGAQQAPPPPPAPGTMQAGPEGDFPPPPFGERMELLGFGGIHGGKIVTGAPFIATAVSETMQTLGDGNHISRKTQSKVYRDSQGRIRRDIVIAGFGAMAPSAQPRSFAVINDPVAGTTFMLHPDQKTAEQMGRRFAWMNGAIQDKMAARQQQEIASGEVKKEDLHLQTIEGVSAQGTRITRIIPAGQIGNERPISIVREIWYSNDLQTVVMSKRSDPWSGETTYRLKDIQRAEPDPALFLVPSDYTVTQGRYGARHQQQAPQPPPDN